MGREVAPGDLALDERLDRIETKQDSVLAAVNQLQVQVAILKAKAAFYGGVAGLAFGALVARLLQ